MNAEREAIVAQDAHFAEIWRGIDWTGAKEVDVREELLTPLLQHLGYSRGTVYDITREETFRLPESFLYIGRKRIDIDYAPKIRLKRVFIVETKSPADLIDHAVLHQALFYANHPEVRARYVALCNGRILEVFRVGSEPYDNPIIRVEQDLVNGENIARLRLFLGAKSAAATLRLETMATLRETLEIELDDSIISAIDLELRSMIHGAKSTVKKKSEELQARAWQEEFERAARERSETPFEKYLITCDVQSRVQLSYGWELGRRLRDASVAERPAMADRLAMTWRSRVHSVFRVHSMCALLVLLESGVVLERTSYIRSVCAGIEELARGASTYYAASNGLANALCHLDNATLRVAFLLAKKVGTAAARDMLVAARSKMEAEERLSDIRSPASSVNVASVILAERLWRKFARLNTAEEVWSGIHDLEVLENAVIALPGGEFEAGDGSTFHFEYYGRGHDILWMGTFDAMNGKFDVLRSSDIQPDVIALAELSWENARDLIPKAVPLPADWAIQDPDLKVIATDLLTWGSSS